MALAIYILCNIDYGLKSGFYLIQFILLKQGAKLNFIYRKIKRQLYGRAIEHYFLLLSSL